MCWSDDDSPERILTLRTRRNTIVTTEHVVDHLTIGRRHRLKNPGNAGVLDLDRHLLGELAKRFLASLAVATDVDP